MNRQIYEVAQATSLNLGAYNLILDSRSETEQSREGIYTRFLGARGEKACFLSRATTEARIIFLSQK